MATARSDRGSYETGGKSATPARRLPASKSQEKKWSKEIRTRLADWVRAEVVMRLQQDLQPHGLPATARAAGDKVLIDYSPLVSGTGPSVATQVRWWADIIFHNSG